MDSRESREALRQDDLNANNFLIDAAENLCKIIDGYDDMIRRAMISP